MSIPAARFTVRDLPFPAKLVVTCFLLAVGLGYSAALVQLHFQDSKSGKAMPTVEDVILKFTGKKWFETDPPRQTSLFVKLITAPPGAPFTRAGTMAPAFTTRDGGDFMKAVRGAETERKRLLPERDGERDALVLWAESPPDVRRKAYEDDHFGPEPGTAPKRITKEFVSPDGAIKVKSIINERCARCHSKDGADAKAANYPLENLAQVEKYLAVPAAVPVPKGGGWVRVEEPIGLEKLTQSTHAHLLSFAVLFSLTGLVFAFTSYPAVVRCVVGPWVLVAIVTDVAFWWLARMSDAYGVYFAMGVVGTGGLAGTGLAAQIGLSLWNMYGPKGKVGLVLVLAVGGVLGALVVKSVVAPGLEKKQQELLSAKADGEKPVEQAPNRPDEPPAKKDEPPKKDVAKNGDKKDPPPAAVSPSRFEKLLRFPVLGENGKEIPVLELKFKKTEDGGMVRALFDRDDGAFKEAEDKAAVTAERHGELAALTAWARLPDAERKRTYQADEFPLPTHLTGKPFTQDYVAAGKVKIRQMVTDRCIRCHESEDDEIKFEDYEGLRRYLEAAAKPAGK